MKTLLKFTFIFCLITQSYISICLSNTFKTHYEYSIRLFNEKDYYRSNSEILKLAFKYPIEYRQSDLLLFELKNLFYLEQFQSLVQQAKLYLNQPDLYNQSLDQAVSEILTVTYLKQNSPDKALNIWKQYSSEGLDTFPTENRINGLIDPVTAGNLSAILPGSGFLLSENYSKAATSFLLNALFIAGCVHYYHKKQWGITALLLFFEIGWYEGGIRASIEYANKYNQKIIQNNQEQWIKRNTAY